MDRGLGAGDAAELAEAAPQHAVAHLVDVARRAPRLARDPGPAGLAPVGALVVAAVLDELAVLRPGDRLGVDLELGDGHRMRCALVVEGEARRPGAEQPARRRKGERRPRRERRGPRHQAVVHRHAQGLRQHREVLEAHLLVEQGEAVEVEGVVVLLAQRRRAGRAWSRATRPGTAGSPAGPAGRRPRGRGGSGGPRWPGRTARRRWAGSRPGAGPADRRPRRARAGRCGRSSTPGTSRSGRASRAADRGWRRRPAAARRPATGPRPAPPRAASPTPGSGCGRRSGPATGHRARHGGAGHSRCRTVWSAITRSC